MIIVKGCEEILSYDSSRTDVATAYKNGYRIVTMDQSLMNSDDDAVIKIDLYNGNGIEKTDTQFVRNDSLDIIKINGDITFPTIRGFKHISKVGKNDLIKTMDGDLIMCKKQEPIKDDEQWYCITSNKSTIISICGIFMEI